MPNTPENDRSEYLDTGMRDPDGRAGFGDDMGTRVGRPDEARVAPHDVSGPPIPGQAGTNTGPVSSGIEGSELDGEPVGPGPQQARVQAAAEGDADLNDQQAAGDNRRVDNL